MKDADVQIPVHDGITEVSLRDFVAPLFRRERIILISFALMFAAVLLAAFVMGPSYSSRMSILVNRERLDPLVSTQANTQLVTTDNAVTQEEINSEVELLRSRDVLEQVVIANGLQKKHGFSLIDLLHPRETEQDRIARAVKGLAKNLQIAPLKESNVIEIEYKSSDPQLSFSVLRSLGNAYLAKHVEVHRPAGSYDFFARETDKYRAELTAAERNLQQFGEKNVVAAPEEERSNLALQVADAVGSLHQAEEAIAADAARIQQDEREVSTIPNRAVTQEASATNDKVIADLNAALVLAETKRTQLALKYDESYPLMKEAEQEIAQDKAALAQAESKKYVTETTDRDPTYELLREDLAKSQVDLAAQRATRVATQRSIQSLQSQMVSLNHLALTEQDLQREAKAAESNYLLYQQKREQERASNALDVTRIANVAIAVPPAVPVLPLLGWPMMVLIGLGVALIVSIGVGYGVDYFDSSFHTPAQVSETLGIPVVIAMPKRTA